MFEDSDSEGTTGTTKTPEKSTPTKTKKDLIAEMGNPRKERAKIADPTYAVIVPDFPFLCDAMDMPKGDRVIP